MWYDNFYTWDTKNKVIFKISNKIVLIIEKYFNGI